MALTLLAGALRFSTLDVQSFSSDEAVTALLVRTDLGSMLSTLPNTESTPPLYYVAAWLWTHVFGGGEVGLRSLSALVGTATIPMVYVAGKELVSRSVGLAAAAVAAVSPMLVGYAQEARSCASVALTGLSFALFVRARVVPKTSTLAGLVHRERARADDALLRCVRGPSGSAAVAAIRRRTRQVVIAVTALLATGLALLPLALEQRENRLAANIAAGDPLPSRIVILAKRYLIGGSAPQDRDRSPRRGPLAAVVRRARRRARKSPGPYRRRDRSRGRRLRDRAPGGARPRRRRLPDYAERARGFVPLAIAGCAEVAVAESRRWVARAGAQPALSYVPSRLPSLSTRSTRGPTGVASPGRWKNRSGRGFSSSRPTSTAGPLAYRSALPAGCRSDRPRAPSRRAAVPSSHGAQARARGAQARPYARSSSPASNGSFHSRGRAFHRRSGSSKNAPRTVTTSPSIAVRGDRGRRACAQRGIAGCGHPVPTRVPAPIRTSYTQRI